MHYKEGESYRTRPLAASQTFKAGAPIVGSAGTFQEAGAAPQSIVGFATAGAAEYAWKHDTFGTVKPAVPVALADQEFRGTLASSASGSDGYEVGPNPQSIVGSAFGLVVDANTGYWVLNKAVTTGNGAIAKVTGVDKEVQEGDFNPPVRFVIIPSARDVIA